MCQIKKLPLVLRNNLSCFYNKNRIIYFINRGTVRFTMMTKNISVTLFFLLLTIWNITGQSNLTLGQWKSHLSYRSGVRITQSPEVIIYAAQRGLFTIDKNDLRFDLSPKKTAFQMYVFQNCFMMHSTIRL